MSAPSSTSRRATGPRSKREREEEQDQRLITLHLLLQALSGQTITVELCSGNLIAGVLHQVDDEMNIQMSRRDFIYPRSQHLLEQRRLGPYRWFRCVLRTHAAGHRQL